MITKEEPRIQSIKSEQDDDYSDDDLYNINSWGADLSFRELITMYKEEDLIKPELQRHYVWDKAEASRFIESILLGLPVPSIFLANQPRSDKRLIIDGYQRIMTVYDYVQRSVFSGDDKVFKLSNSKKINQKWRNKTFSELSEAEQRRLKNTTIHAIIFEQKHPKNDDTSLYQIFERINTSGRTLFAQEIRNCVYQGEFNTQLINLNQNQNWRALFGMSPVDSRMRDMEYILRFLALATDDIRNQKVKQISMKKYLNDFMGNADSRNQDILKTRGDIFINTINYIFNNIGVDAFKNVSSKDHEKVVDRFHPTIFDAIAVATALSLNMNPNMVTNNLKEKRINLIQDKDFNKYISTRTTDVDHIKGRINLAMKYLYGLNYE